MDKAKRILEEALSYKNCDGLIEENSRLEDAVLYAINKALRQPLVSGRSEQLPLAEIQAMLIEAHNQLAKSGLSMDEYNPISSALVEAKMKLHELLLAAIATNAGRLAVVTEFKKPKMNSEQFILELSKAMSVDGRVNVDRYCKVLELVNTYISSNYSKPLVSGQSEQFICPCCGSDKTYRTDAI